MNNDTFEFDKMKEELTVIREAATLYIQKHNPHRQLLNEPYATLVRTAINDFLFLEAHGFKIIIADELSAIQKHNSDLLSTITRNKETIRERDREILSLRANIWDMHQIIGQ